MPSAVPFIQELSADICSPFFSPGPSKLLHFIAQEAGEIYVMDRSDRVQRKHLIDGMPSSAVFGQDGTLYIADVAAAAIVAVDSFDHIESIVSVYEEEPLKGPNQIVIDRSGTMYFTDSGPFGETGLHSRRGSLFKIANSHSGQLLQPITLETLAFPWGLAVSPDGKFLYVAETMANRVLRYFQKPAGAGHGSVFVQLSGRIGPSALVCDQQGSLYVAHYDISESSRDGVVYVINKSGVVTSTITVAGPAITGLAISPDNRTLYITEQTTKCIYRIDL